MLSSIWKKLFKDRKEDQAVELLSPLAKRLQEDVALESQGKARYQHPVPHVRLRPVLPLGEQDAEDGWCGGDPCLPDDVAWPEIDGQDAYFVCQINCARLPDDIWQGVGPREGWLAVFFGQNGARVLYNKDLGQPRAGPDQGGADWFRPRQDERVHDRNPKWPIRVETHHGSSEASAQPPQGLADLGKDRAEPAMLIGETPDVTDPGQWPFDAKSLDLMISLIEDDVDRWARRAEALLQERADGDLGPEDADTVLGYAETILGEADAFHAIKARAAEVAEDAAAAGGIAGVMADLRDFTLTRCQREKSGAPLYSETAPIFDKPKNFFGSWWFLGFFKWLYEHAKHVYSENPDQLPGPSRARFETMWAQETRFSIGGMGHVAGFIEMPFGAGTPNELLLELNSSNLFGWIWGDLYSLVLIVPREDLEKCQFDAVSFEITN